jgi:hypothetical protein
MRKRIACTGCHDSSVTVATLAVDPPVHVRDPSGKLSRTSALAWRKFTEVSTPS